MGGAPMARGTRGGLTSCKFRRNRWICFGRKPSPCPWGRRVEGGAGEWGRCGLGWGDGELEGIKVGDVAAAAVRVHRQSQDVLAGGQRDRTGGEIAIGLPAARRLNCKGWGDRFAVDFEVELA